MSTALQLDGNNVLAVFPGGLCHLVALHLLNVPALQSFPHRILAGGAGLVATDGLADMLALQQPGARLPTFHRFVVWIVGMAPASLTPSIQTTNFAEPTFPNRVRVPQGRQYPQRTPCILMSKADRILVVAIDTPPCEHPLPIAPIG
jgi:hypothetical protein